MDLRSDLPVRFPTTTPTESRLTLAGSVSKRLANSSGTGDKTETTKGFGTTNALVVLKDALVAGADSRLTSYENEILSERHKLDEIPEPEDGEISTIPPGRTTYTVATWADDEDDAMRYLTHLDEAANKCEECKRGKAIISAASEYAAIGQCEQGFQSYICSLESETLEAYRVYVLILHNPKCKLPRQQNCPCSPTRLHGFTKLKPGIYALGSGSMEAIEYLAVAFGIDPERIVPDENVGYKIEDLELKTSVDEVKKGVWLGLKASALADKFTGTPFRVCTIKADGNYSIEGCSFLRLHFQFHADKDDDRSVFLAYPRILVREDHGHNVVKTLLGNLKAKRNANSYAHPLTWLR